ncbi:hypothetical protein CP533_1371 [Ophiocordyceps camponoti-saundersi (nom. inval.)]|nr:hypothetical protein CP533_1371 [Ophiocordyceps camponoti-saundersi (nom. inval.)]
MASYSNQSARFEDSDVDGDSVGGAQTSLARASLDEGPVTLVKTKQASTAEAIIAGGTNSFEPGSQGLHPNENKGAYPKGVKCSENMASLEECADNRSSDGTSSTITVLQLQKSTSGMAFRERLTKSADDSASSNMSGSEMYSDDEFELFDENDDAYTVPSTPGANSPCGASSGEELSSTKGPYAASSTARTGGWSASDDDLLKSLKKSPKLSWYEIGQAVGRTKEEARARWRNIQRRVRKKEKARKMKGEQAAKKASEAGLEELFLLEGEEDDDDDGVDELNANYGWPPKNGADHESDGFDGPSDRDVLASEQDGLKKAKWLERQANFLNAGGELIPLYVIRENWLNNERERDIQQDSEDEKSDTSDSDQEQEAEAIGFVQGGLGEAHV